MMEILGYICAVFIGISLGLIGGGGSILTVPVLTYLFGKSAKEATAYSLFVVGISALFGTIRMIRQKQVDFVTGLVFAVPALSAVYFTRRVLVPAIPPEIMSLGDFVLTDNIAIMVLFALVMLMASVSMIRGRKDSGEEESKPVYNYPMILLEGLLVGILTGVIGAGGGFLIIPALVLLAKLPMKRAVGTSLMIISVKSLFGFIGDVKNPELIIDWNFLLIFSSISVVGIFIGSFLSKFISGAKLKKGFGWFVLVMGVYILLKELI